MQPATCSTCAIREDKLLEMDKLLEARPPFRRAPPGSVHGSMPTWGLSAGVAAKWGAAAVASRMGAHGGSRGSPAAEPAQEHLQSQLLLQHPAGRAALPGVQTQGLLLAAGLGPRQ